MERSVESIQRWGWSDEFLLYLMVIFLIFSNITVKSDMEENETTQFNITMEPYNFTTENVTYYDRSEWAMRLFGTLLTPIPIVDRSLSTMIYILFDCGKCSPDVKEFLIKPYSGGSWSTVARDHWFKDPEYYGGGYFIYNLSVHTQYVIKAKLDTTTTVSAVGTTCQDYVGSVSNYRIETVGAAWLDVRWEKPDEDCDGKYYYKFIYHNTDAYTMRDEVFANNVTRFGMYFRNDSPGPQWVWTNLHPCPFSKKTVCLFIGEHVRPNSTHVVSVKAIRFGSSSWEETGDYVTTSARTTFDYDKYPPSFCPRQSQTALYIIILLVVLNVTVLVACIVVGELLRRLKIKEKQLDRGQRKEMKKADKAKKKSAREARKKRRGGKKKK